MFCYKQPSRVDGVLYKNVYQNYAHLISLKDCLLYLYNFLALPYFLICKLCMYSPAHLVEDKLRAVETNR